MRLLYIDESAEREYAEAMADAIMPELSTLVIEQLRRFHEVAREWDGRDPTPCAIDTAFHWLRSVMFDAANEGYKRALAQRASPDVTSRRDG